MRKLLAKSKGQSIMEYVIISSLIGIFCLVMVKNFGEVIENRIEHMKKMITKNIRIN